MPALGVNACRAGAELTCLFDKTLHKRFGKTDTLFNPPESTFEPTKKEANIGNINTVPEKDILYFDCRVLPAYPLDEVEAVAREVADAVEKNINVKIEIESWRREDAAPPTPADSEVVRRLAAAIKAVRGIDAKPWGIGAGTIAAHVRKAGFNAVVWGTLDNTLHQPNEYYVIANMVADAKVYAHLCGQ